MEASPVNNKFVDVVGMLETNQAVERSVGQFDLGAELTEGEKALVGLLREAENDKSVSPVTVKDLEEDMFSPQEDVKPTAGNDEYNQQYVYWTRCQALLALKGYEEGWAVFEELVLNPYVQLRRRENAGYTGNDRDEAFALRLRQREAEDFLKHIHSCFEEAAAVRKPANPGA